jgi:hypothetical protein
MLIKYNLNYDKEISYSNEYFANELFSSAFQTLSLVIIENDANRLNDANHSNDISQSNETALNAWNDEKFSKKLFSDEIQMLSVCKFN